MAQRRVTGTDEKLLAKRPEGCSQNSRRRTGWAGRAVASACPRHPGARAYPGDAAPSAPLPPAECRSPSPPRGKGRPGASHRRRPRACPWSVRCGREDDTWTPTSHNRGLGFKSQLCFLCMPSLGGSGLRLPVSHEGGWDGARGSARAWPGHLRWEQQMAGVCLGLLFRHTFKTNKNRPLPRASISQLSVGPHQGLLPRALAEAPLPSPSHNPTLCCCSALNTRARGSEGP